MRKSGYHVDDAGDASNTEIGHVPTCLLEPISLSHDVCDLAESGFLGRGGNLGRDSRRVPDEPLIRTVAGAMPNQTCAAARERRPPFSTPQMLTRVGTLSVLGLSSL
jgi:hypothetical protein